MNTEINMPDAFATGLTTDGDEIDVDSLTTTISSNINENSQIARPRNRAERRALAKKLGKKGRQDFGTISETAKKLNYIELIQKLRQLNEEKEQENE
jgi:hypothetical protein